MKNKEENKELPKEKSELEKQLTEESKTEGVPDLTKKDEQEIIDATDNKEFDENEVVKLDVDVNESYEDYIERLDSQGLGTTLTKEEYENSKTTYIENILVNSPELNIEKDGKIYTIDMDLKKEDESTEEFLLRAAKEELFEDMAVVDENEETVLEFIYRIRLAIDKTMRRVETMYGEKSDVWKSLFASKAWLGKLLGQLGTVNPYITDKPIKTAKEIPATADVYDNPAEMQKFSLNGELEKVLMLRDDIYEIVSMNTSIDLTEMEMKNGRLGAIALTNSYINACEANFELGYQLSVIKKG